MSNVLTIIATWRAKPGEEERVAALLAEFLPLVRQEPGCLKFVTHRGVEDPRRFVHYEQYRDHAAFLAHKETAHFQDYVLGRCVPLLEERAVYLLDELPL